MQSNAIRQINSSLSKFKLSKNSLRISITSLRYRKALKLHFRALLDCGEYNVFMAYNQIGTDDFTRRVGMYWGVLAVF